VTDSEEKRKSRVAGAFDPGQERAKGPNVRGHLSRRRLAGEPGEPFEEWDGVLQVEVKEAARRSGHARRVLRLLEVGAVGEALPGGAVGGDPVDAARDHDLAANAAVMDRELAEVDRLHLVPTLGAPKAVLDSAKAGMAIHEASLRKQLDASKHHQRNVGRAIKAGVKVAMGTDAGVSRHGDNIREIEYLVEAGMTPQNAWIAATRNAAELLGVLDDLGTIEAGKKADLVLLKGDALDVKGLPGRVAAVYKDGKRVVG